MKLSPHFSLAEFLPKGLGPDDVPARVLANLIRLCTTILEPVRENMQDPLIIHSGYRPPAANSGAGGVSTSDHLHGRAADFHVGAGDWELRTIAAFHWMRAALKGHYGQIILEDHRKALGKPGKLWIHAAVTSQRHPGRGDALAVLKSNAPGQYEPYTGDLA